MAGCELLEDDGSPADIKSGDVITSNGGILGLGHAGVIEVRKDCIVVIEVFAAPDGSVHVQERDICDFMDDYDAQGREVFISRPKKPKDTSDQAWDKKLKGAVDYMKSKVCTHYPVYMFILDALFHLPDVWYCSDLVQEAFRRQGIEFEISLNLWDASDDKATRDYMFQQRGEAIRRYGEKMGLRYLRGFELPETFIQDSQLPKENPDTPPVEQDAEYAVALANHADCDCSDHDLERMVSEQLWKKELSRLSGLIDIEFNLASEMIKKEVS